MNVHVHVDAVAELAPDFAGSEESQFHDGTNGI
jgi:hypothetical protein